MPTSERKSFSWFNIESIIYAFHLYFYYILWNSYCRSMQDYYFIIWHCYFTGHQRAGYYEFTFERFSTSIVLFDIFCVFFYFFSPSCDIIIFLFYLSFETSNKGIERGDLIREIFVTLFEIYFLLFFQSTKSLFSRCFWISTVF